MNREIKFRAWNGKEMLHEDIWNILNGYKPNDFRVASQTDKPFELMQYTGLKDKNDVEIFEGDIIRYWDKMEHKINWIIEWRLEGHNGWVMVDKKADEYRYFAEPIYLEVIGNIYENKQLLKNK